MYSTKRVQDVPIRYKKMGDLDNLFTFNQIFKEFFIAPNLDLKRKKSFFLLEINLFYAEYLHDYFNSINVFSQEKIKGNLQFRNII